jgi:cytochrome c biogenesis protein CcmG/thiol:disulfide interchange protein DsbE
MADSGQRLKNQKHLLVSFGFLVAIFIVVAILWRGLNQNPNTAPMALQDKPANGFNVLLLQGKEHLATPKEVISLNDFIGKPLILNFWASWCFSCREEARLMEAYWKKYGPQGVQMVGIAIQDTPAAALEFAKYYGKTYILALDEDGKAGIDYGITGVPETFFIDAKGQIRHKEAAPLTPELLEKYIALIKN